MAKPPTGRGRGFASMTPERRSEIARLGGLAAATSGYAHHWTPEQARAAGSIGGKKSRRGPTRDAALIRRRLRETGGKVSLVARELGIPYSTVKNYQYRAEREA